MSTTIVDPRTHDGMHVDAKFRAHVSSITQEEKDGACDAGWKFNINTGDITLTSAALTTVLYIKNTSDYDLVFSSFIYNLGATTGGSGDVIITLYRNPTAGSIITNANNVEVGTGVEANQNFGSTKTLTGLFYKGATGETAVSGGNNSVITRSASNTGRIVISLGALVLPQGSSIAVNYTPPASNTSQKCQFAASCHLRHPDVVAD